MFLGYFIVVPTQFLLTSFFRGSTNYIRIRDKPIDTKGEGKQEVYENSEYFDMGIFLAFFIIVSLICLILLIKVFKHM